MATPAAVLSILVKAQGAQATAGQLGAVDKAGRNAGKGLATTEKHAKRTSGAMSALGTAAKSAGVLVGAAGLAAGLKMAVGEYREAQKVGAQTTAVIKSTGGAAKVTRKHIEDLAGAISRKSGIDDEAIQSGSNLLLTFKDIRNESGKGNKIFDQATQVITDMSVVMKQGLKPSAIQVGKALNDPVKGLSALGRVGVQFTEDQKKQVAALVANGDKLGAQKIILKELKDEFAGSAAAQATAGDKLKVAWGNLAEAAGRILVPALDKIATFMTKVINAFVEGKGIAKFKNFVKGAAGVISDFVGKLDIGGKVKSAKDAISSFFDDIGKHKTAGKSLGASIGASVADAIAKINWTEVGNTVAAGLRAAMEGIQIVGKFSGNLAAQISQGIAAAVSRVNGRQALGKLLDVVGEALNALFSPSFWREHFAAIFSIVTFVIPIGKILKIPGFATLFRFISEPLFKAVLAVGQGLRSLLGEAGSRAFTAFLAELERAAPRTANAMLKIATSGGDALRGFPGRVAGFARSAMDGLVSLLTGAVGRVGGVMGRLVGSAVAKLISGVGRFDDAAGRLVAAIIARFGVLLSRIPRALGDALAAGTAKLRDWAGNFDNAGVAIGKAIVVGVLGGLAMLGHTILNKFKDAANFVIDNVGNLFKGVGKKITGGIGKISPFGDGLGKLPAGGKGSASLMGANSSLAPFARIGAGYGLHVSSGRRPGAITSSGNQSYHSTGEAIDEAGSPAGMLAFFKFMRSTYGSRLAELIYTPGGVGIKNGRPYTYTGQVAADHFDHVHVALDLGKPGPGIGDGIGKRLRGHLMGDGYGKTQLQSLWQRAGGPAGAANIAAAIALAESGGNSMAKHRNTDGSIDRGLWQINSVHGAQSTFSPIGNARAAVSISSGGRNWNPWVTFKTGAYKKFLSGSAQAIRGTKKGTKGTGVKNPKTAASKAHEIASKVPFGPGFTPQQIEEINAETERRVAVATAAQTPASTDEAGGEDPNQALIDAIAEQVAAEKAHTDALNALKDAVDAQNAIAGSTIGIGLREAQRALADIISGQLGGYSGAGGRALTAGSGSVVRY